MKTWRQIISARSFARIRCCLLLSIVVETCEVSFLSYSWADPGVCGSKYWQKLLLPDHFAGADFRPFCNAHDDCYETCQSKDQCDAEFHAGLRKSCKDTYATDWHILQREARLETANSYYSAVHRMGGEAYRADRPANCSSSTDPLEPTTSVEPTTPMDPVDLSIGQIYQAVYGRAPSDMERMEVWAIIGANPSPASLEAEIVNRAINRIYQNVYRREPTTAEREEIRTHFANRLVYSEVWEKVAETKLVFLWKKRALQFLFNQYAMKGL